MKAKLLNQFNQATDFEQAIGSLWYEHAYAKAEAIAKASGLSVETVIGVIAALSPRIHWARNIRLAEQAVKDGADSLRGVFGINKAKAKAILEGNDPLDVLNSPKVRNFYLSILHKGECDAVCVDVWAARAAGYPEGKFPKKDYDKIAQAYREAAKEAGISAAKFQAIIWVVARGGGD